MTFNKYEGMYLVTHNAVESTSEITKVAHTLQGLGVAVTCKELGELLYGDAYKRLPCDNDRLAYYHNEAARKLTGKLNQSLQHLLAAGVITQEKTKSDPYTYEVKEWHRIDENGESERIDVWDKNGNHYEIDNPKYDYRHTHGEYRMVTKTGRKTLLKYKWIDG